MAESNRPAPGPPIGGRYRLLRRLGSGGMASVWLARDERLGREVAVKLLSDVLAEEESYLRRFEREAQVAAQLTHPHLVSVYDFSADADRPYLVMELIEGGTLADRLAQGAAVDQRRLARELLAALDCIHRAGVVHRDVKPANVLIDERGHARLGDFGVVRPDQGTALTETGFVLGTRNYIAPEVEQGRAATPRSDLYALGRILREVGGDRDPALAGLVASMTADDPDDRPQSAQVALATLERSLRTSLASAEREPNRTATTASLPAPSWTRHRGLLAMVAVSVGVVLLAVVGVILAIGGDEQGAATPASGTSAPEESGPEPSAPTDEEACAALEEQKKALEEEKKAAEEATADPEEKEAINQRYEEQKVALDEQIKACQEGSP